MPEISPLEQPIPLINMPLWQALLIGAAIFIVYLILTRSQKKKEFKPLDMKKETRRRFKKEYKYFGQSLGKPIFDAEGEKPVAFGIGYMKVVEMVSMKRLEPVYAHIPKEKVQAKYADLAQEIYQKNYGDLNDIEKRNVNEVAKEELRNEKVLEMPLDEKSRIVSGKKEIRYSIPEPMFMFKICSPDAFSKFMARLFGVGIDWALFNKNQVSFYPEKVILEANFQRRTPNDVFVFSKEGKNLVQDISYEVEREAIWQETANQIPRAVHFDTEASKELIYRREDARIEKDKRRAQSESHDFR